MAALSNVVTVRRARTSDVPALRRLIDSYVPDGILLDKAMVTLYEDIQEFWVAERVVEAAEATTAIEAAEARTAIEAETAEVARVGEVGEALEVTEAREATGAEEAPAEVIGCGALHVMWEDLAEVRTLAVDKSVKGLGVGHLVLDKLLETARWLGVRRIFCLTFEVDFFAKHGFVEIGETPVDGDVYSELLRSYDEGVAEFLGLERVKPNTLGNSRMLLHL
ncbi:amino-acid N-acetyltransferase [Streptomyces varsoviensis]|uniref:amino-acid N-acetyltransferase n=1 Tax=Streptomyces varsoviensis TaxID=67373 RepID=UPI00340C3A1D